MLSARETHQLGAFAAEFDPRTQVFLPSQAAGHIQLSGTGRGQILSIRVAAHRIDCGSYFREMRRFHDDAGR